jgi:hypothetical protein
MIKLGVETNGKGTKAMKISVGISRKNIGGYTAQKVFV